MFNDNRPGTSSATARSFVPSANAFPVISPRTGGPFRRGICTVWQTSNTGLRVVRRLLPFALLGLGLVLCFRTYRTLDWRALSHDLRHAGPWVLLVLLAPIVGIFLHMLGWRALLDRNMRPTLWRAFRIFVAAQAGNEIGASVLGETVKVVAFPRERRASAIRAVVWDNLIAFAALIVVLLVVTTLPIPALFGSASFRVCRAIVFLGLAVGAALWIFLSGKTTACPPIPIVLFAFLAHLVGKLWIVAEFFLALALLATASWYSSALLGFASTLASCVGAPVPGQLGITECALVSCASIAHIHVSTVLSVAILRRARSFFWVILGAAFYVAIRLTTQSMRVHASPAGSI